MPKPSPVSLWLALIPIHFTHGPLCRTCPLGLCQVPSQLDYGLDAEGIFHGYGLHHSRASLLWLAYEAEVCRLEGLLPAANGTEVRLGLRHLPMDGYHSDTITVFEFHGCLFHVTTSSGKPGSALLPRISGTTLKGTKATWGPLVATCSWPSGSASGRPSSTPTL